jgi:monoamine oxidase
MPPDARMQCLASGFETLPRELHTRFHKAGGETRLRHRLTRLDRAEEGGVELTFRHDDEDGPAVLVRAGRVVLTLPPRALELLEPDTFFLRDAGVQGYLGSVERVGAVKLFLVYPSPWWETTGVQRGRSTTDLPLRQLWYFGGGGKGPALILAAYADGAAAEHWRGLREGEPFPAAAAVPSATASRRMVEAAHAMLMEVHGVESAPTPSAACWHDWSADPFGGGWHVWREGYDPRLVIPALRQPVPGEAVYLAGDAWSHEPGSVQGALATAECVLQDHFGLSWPEWLRRGGTRLGPRRAG